MDDLKKYHSWHPSGVEWRIVRRGIEVRGVGIPRTSGRPATMERILRLFYFHLRSSSVHYGVPIELIMATIATEAGTGKPRFDIVREEPGYVSDEATPDRVSYGLMHTLLSSARAVLKPEMSDVKAIVTGSWLEQPANGIRAGTAYLARDYSRTSFDPVLSAAAYNAGSLRNDLSPGNRWKLLVYPRGTGRHLDRFVPWYNDAAHVVEESRKGGLDIPSCHSEWHFGNQVETPAWKTFLAAKAAGKWRLSTYA